jgi:twinfilin-like protein
MKHTMAIPGLLVHAEDVGVLVDQKIEIHDPEDLVFEAKDDRVGRFRSMYARKGVYKGTEMQYEALERDKQFAENIR